MSSTVSNTDICFTDESSIIGTRRAQTLFALPYNMIKNQVLLATPNVDLVSIIFTSKKQQQDAARKNRAIACNTGYLNSDVFDVRKKLVTVMTELFSKYFLKKLRKLRLSYPKKSETDTISDIRLIKLRLKYYGSGINNNYLEAFKEITFQRLIAMKDQRQLIITTNPFLAGKPKRTRKTYRRMQRLYVIYTLVACHLKKKGLSFVVNIIQKQEFLRYF